MPEHEDDLVVSGCAPSELDTGVPTSARMYNYYLGGEDNFRADRDAAEQLLKVVPGARANARANRAFLGRAVRALVDEGLSQFLDIGVGLPGPGGTVETVRSLRADARIVGVDNDPIVLAHARAQPSGADPVTVVTADLRDPASILAHPEIRAVIDFDRPVAILLVAILHFVGDADDPYAIVRTLMDAVAPGSCLVISHAAANPDPVRVNAGVDAYEKTTTSLALRSAEQVARFFDGLDLLEPGLVRVPLWRPDGDVPADADKIFINCGVGRKV